MKKKYIFLVLCLSLLKSLSSENLTFNQPPVFTFNAENKDESECYLGFDDAIILSIEEVPFLKGVEVEVFQDSPNSLFYTLYSLTELPKEKQVNVNLPIIREGLQAKKNFVLQFPIDEKSKLSSSHTVRVIPYFLNDKTSPLLINFSPESSKKEEKGEKLKIKLRPIFQDVGGIKFNIIYPPPVMCFNSSQIPEVDENKEVVVKVDDKYVKDLSKPFMTRVGQHRIQVDSHFYKSEIVSCLIEKGKIEVVDVFLKSTIPFLSIEGPISTTVYLDDKRIRLPFSSHVTYGNHVIRVKLDGYEIVRSLKTEEGKTYLLNIALDIKLIEH